MIRLLDLGVLIRIAHEDRPWVERRVKRLRASVKNGCWRSYFQFRFSAGGLHLVTWCSPPDYCCDCDPAAPFLRPGSGFSPIKRPWRY
jgi:hypothetical protein